MLHIPVLIFPGLFLMDSPLLSKYYPNSTLRSHEFHYYVAPDYYLKRTSSSLFFIFYFHGPYVHIHKHMCISMCIYKFKSKFWIWYLDFWVWICLTHSELFSYIFLQMSWFQFFTTRKNCIMYTNLLPFLFNCWWTSRLIPFLRYCEWLSNKHDMQVSHLT